MSFSRGDLVVSSLGRGFHTKVYFSVLNAASPRTWFSFAGDLKRNTIVQGFSRERGGGKRVTCRKRSAASWSLVVNPTKRNPGWFLNHLELCLQKEKKWDALLLWLQPLCNTFVKETIKKEPQPPHTRFCDKPITDTVEARHMGWACTTIECRGGG